jgi:hypothetical protein
MAATLSAAQMFLSEDVPSLPVTIALQLNQDEMLTGAE